LEKRDCLDNSWQKTLEKILNQNINLFPIPNKSKNIQSWLDQLKVDLFVLSGGNNIGSEPDRDYLEKIIINYSIAFKIPLLAVCRGMQYLHSSQGGKLVNAIDHINVNHKVNIIDNQNQEKTFLVNSFHNFSIKEINNNKFKAIAFSEEGNIEAMVHNEYPWLAIMWHPEREFENNSLSINFLKHNLELLLKKWKKN
tara:strand:+ start:542 stop:1132 length:591 start_codon:yes stop_codon:yes gene_type:complete